MYIFSILQKQKQKNESMQLVPVYSRGQRVRTEWKVFNFDFEWTYPSLYFPYTIDI